MKTKSTGPKSLTNKATKSDKGKSSVSVKALKKPAQKASVASESYKISTSKPTEKVSLAERMSKSTLVKSAAAVKMKNQRANLKLVAKTGSKVPVSKITRSDGGPSSNPATGKVIAGKFGSEQSPAKPVLAVRQSVEKMMEMQSTKPAESVSIEGVRTTVVGGQEHHIYNIKILDSGMKVMVPVSQASAVGLRRIVDKKAIDTVYDILRDRNFKIDTQTWNRRFREYSQKIKTGSVFEIAIVLRDLSVLSSDKELSFGEKKMLDMAEALLVSEIALAKARPHDKVAGELKSLFV